MIEFLAGGLCVAVLYTFAPSLAVIPSLWLRRAWAWLNDKRPQ